MDSWLLAIGNSLVFWLALGGIVFPLLLAWWAANDAKQRNKSPMLVALCVVFFFPIGLIVWLLFRPELTLPTGQRRPFNLQDFRVQ